MMFRTERISKEEAEKMIKELSKSYEEDGFFPEEARIMAISDLREEYEW